MAKPCLSVSRSFLDPAVAEALEIMEKWRSSRSSMWVPLCGKSGSVASALAVLFPLIPRLDEKEGRKLGHDLDRWIFQVLKILEEHCEDAEKGPMHDFSVLNSLLGKRPDCVLGSHRVTVDDLERFLARGYLGARYLPTQVGYLYLLARLLRSGKCPNALLKLAHQARLRTNCVHENDPHRDVWGYYLIMKDCGVSDDVARKLLTA